MQESKNAKKFEAETLYAPLEKSGEIILKILGLCIIYFIFDFIGKSIGANDATSDTLLSIVVLPAIYVLKDVYEIFTPFTVTVSLSDKDITVTQGIYTKRLDCLKLDTIENVELITTALGRCKNYGTLDLYSYGSAIRIPNVKDYMKIKADIESRIEACKRNKE